MAWSLAKFHVVELVRVLRQRDPRLVNALNDVRRGFVPVGGAASTLFRGLSRPLPPSAEGVLPTRLHGVNASVGAENHANSRASTARRSRSTRAIPATTPARWRRFDATVPAPQSLTLKVGAQVVLLRNLDDSLVNGSRGVVKAFVGTRETEYVRHKCSFRIHPKLARAAETLFPRVPLVAFDNGRVVAVGPAQFDARRRGEVRGATADALKLAWALTVHKSQGMTISRLEVSLRDAFDYGQVCVALSRATSVEGLRVTGFDEAKVRVHPARRRVLREPRRRRRRRRRRPRIHRRSEWRTSASIRTAESRRIRRRSRSVSRGADAVGGCADASLLVPNASRPVGRYVRTRRPSPRFGDASAGGSCFRCGRAGHWASRCPFANAGAANAASPARGFADGPSAYEGRGATRERAGAASAQSTGRPRRRLAVGGIHHERSAESVR